MNDIFKVGVKRYLYHAELVRFRKYEMGVSQVEFSKYLEMRVNKYQEIEQLKRYPTEDESHLIADFLGVNAYQLFPKWTIPIYGARMDCKIVDISPVQLGSREVLALADPKENEVELSREKTGEIMKALNTLEPRQKKIIELRYGFNGEIPLTLDEIGKKIGVSRERVRQIEHKAINKLRCFHRDLRGLIIETKKRDDRQYEINKYETARYWGERYWGYKDKYETYEERRQRLNKCHINPGW